MAIFSLLLTFYSLFFFFEASGVVKPGPIFPSTLLKDLIPNKTLPENHQNSLEEWNLFPKITPKTSLFSLWIKEETFLVRSFIILENNSAKEKIKEILWIFPSYFLHDKMLEQFENLWGRPTLVKTNREDSRFYFWQKDKIKFFYKASCILTCFPETLYALSEDSKEGILYKWLKDQNLLKSSLDPNTLFLRQNPKNTP